MHRRQVPRNLRFGVGGPALAVALAALTSGIPAVTVSSPAPAIGPSPSVVPATSTATVMAWGDNSAGELGNASLTPSSQPVGVNGLAGVEAIASGGRHNLALTSGGTVVAWGDDTFGELGDGHSGTNASAGVPVSVRGLTGVTAIAAGTEHSLALLSTAR